MLYIMRIQKGIWLYLNSLIAHFIRSYLTMSSKLLSKVLPRPPRTLQRRSLPQRQVWSSRFIYLPFLKPASRNFFFLIIKSNLYSAPQETLSFGLDQDPF